MFFNRELDDKSVIQAAAILREFVEEIKKSNDPEQQAMTMILSDNLANNMQEWREAFDERFFEAGGDVKQYVKQVRPVLEALQIYARFKRDMGETFKDPIEELPEEIKALVENPKVSQHTAIEYNPFLTNAMTAAAREGEESLISFSNRQGVNRTMVRKEGSLGVYDTSVLNRVIWEYRLGNVTSKGEVVFILDDLCRALNGKKGTPSAKQREDVTAALETIRNTPFSFITSDELSAILGVEAAAKLEGFKGLKDNDPKLHETHLIDKLDMVTRYKRRGKKTTAVVLTFGDTFRNMIDSFQWFEKLKTSDNNVQYLKEGQLVDWAYTKDRKALQFYIYRKVFGKVRANADGKPLSNKINYSKMFADCGIDISHQQTKKRKIEDVMTIFEDLQRKDYVIRFKEYDNENEKRAGIQYTTHRVAWGEEEV